MSYKVMVWGAGRLGAMCIREVLARPAFQLVGVRTYSTDKNGMDAGSFAGCEPAGVRMTASDEELTDTPCDCVLYMARDWGDFSTLPELIRLLENGKNVITPLPYHNVWQSLSEEPGVMIDRACRVGGSTFFATGVNPDVVNSRILPSLTGMCTDLETVTLREVWRCGCILPAELGAYGFGLAVSDAATIKKVYDDSIHFLRAICYTASADFGLPVGAFRSSVDLIAAPSDVTTSSGYDIVAGTVAGIVHRLAAFRPGESDHAWITAETNWIATDDLTVEGITAKEHWEITITGNPSLRMGLAMKPREQRSAAIRYCGDDYVATLAACIQAVPAVVDAPPGVLAPPGPLVCWKARLGRGVKVSESCFPSHSSRQPDTHRPFDR